MPGKSTGTEQFVVVVSFNGLDVGDRFEQDADDLGWALQHVETGYLRMVPKEAPDGSDEGKR